jgi:hypothetical protein
MPERDLPEGGYCLSGCRVAFSDEARADAHTHMTGHATGWPFEDVDWPLATYSQVMGTAGVQPVERGGTTK